MPTKNIGMIQQQSMKLSPALISQPYGKKSITPKLTFSSRQQQTVMHAIVFFGYSKKIWIKRLKVSSKCYVSTSTRIVHPIAEKLNVFVKILVVNELMFYKLSCPIFERIHSGITLRHLFSINFGLWVWHSSIFETLTKGIQVAINWQQEH